MSPAWCWAHELGQPDTWTRSVGLRARAGLVRRDAPASGDDVIPSAHTDDPVHARMRATGASSTRARFRLARLVRTAGTSTTATLRSTTFCSRDRQRAPSA